MSASPGSSGMAAIHSPSGKGYPVAREGSIVSSGDNDLPQDRSPSAPLNAAPRGNWFQWSAWYFWVIDFNAGTRFGDTRLCHNWEPWLSGYCLWHAPAVVTDAITMNCASTSAASVAHSTRVYKPVRGFLRDR